MKATDKHEYIDASIERRRAVEGLSPSEGSLKEASNGFNVAHIILSRPAPEIPCDPYTDFALPRGKPRIAVEP